MPLTCQPLPLPLDTPFRTAHGESRKRTNALVELKDGDHSFFGEGALPPYYAHDVGDIARYVETLPETDKLLAGPPFALDAALTRLPDGPAPARCAVDLALHDRWAQHMGRPLYELLGLLPTDAPPSSITLSLSDDPETLREKVRRQADAPVVKLKLGSGSIEQDEQAVRVVQEETEAALGVDANEAWTVEEAATLIPRLSTLLFVEEPLRKRTSQAWQALHEALSVNGTPHAPLIADESIQRVEDVPQLAPWVDGINVKLAKAGGLASARQWMAVARALNLKVLLGCMIESSLAVTAAAHLAPLADFADLDGALSLSDDPFSGAWLDTDYRLQLPDRPGLGTTKRK